MLFIFFGFWRVRDFLFFLFEGFFKGGLIVNFEEICVPLISLRLR
jgi:hypothetical protein